MGCSGEVEKDPCASTNLSSRNGCHPLQIVNVLGVGPQQDFLLLQQSEEEMSHCGLKGPWKEGLGQAEERFGILSEVVDLEDRLRHWELKLL